MVVQQSPGISRAAAANTAAVRAVAAKGGRTQPRGSFRYRVSGLSMEYWWRFLKTRGERERKKMQKKEVGNEGVRERICNVILIRNLNLFQLFYSNLFSKNYIKYIYINISVFIFVIFFLLICAVVFPSQHFRLCPISVHEKRTSVAVVEGRKQTARYPEYLE